MGHRLRAAGQGGSGRKAPERAADQGHRARDSRLPRPGAGRTNGGAPRARRRSAAPAEREGRVQAMSLRLAPLLLLTTLFGCAAAARPQAMVEVDRTREGQASLDARKTAPQAYARAELLRKRAELAYADGDLTTAQVVSEQALAAYLRATIEARLTRAEARLAEAQLIEKQQSERLAQLDAEQQRLSAETADLELRAKVLRDAEPLAKN